MRRLCIRSISASGASLLTGHVEVLHSEQSRDEGLIKDSLVPSLWITRQPQVSERQECDNFNIKSSLKPKPPQVLLHNDVMFNNVTTCGYKTKPDLGQLIGLLEIVGLFNIVIAHQIWGTFFQSVTYFIQCVIRQSHTGQLRGTQRTQGVSSTFSHSPAECNINAPSSAAHLRDGPDDGPVLPGHAWSRHGHPGLLGAALSVHISATFLCVRRSRKYNVSHWCAGITMVTWSMMKRCSVYALTCKCKYSV